MGKTRRGVKALTSYQVFVIAHRRCLPFSLGLLSLLWVSDHREVLINVNLPFKGHRHHPPPAFHHIGTYTQGARACGGLLVVWWCAVDCACPNASLVKVSQNPTPASRGPSLPPAHPSASPPILTPTPTTTHIPIGSMAPGPRRSAYLVLLALALLCGVAHGALPKIPGTNLVQRFIKGKQADPRDHATDAAMSEEDFHEAAAPVLAEDIAEAISISTKPQRRRYVLSGRGGLDGGGRGERGGPPQSTASRL